MDEVISGVSVSMIRENLDNIPSYVMPNSYTIRLYKPGDEEAWLRIEREAEKHFPITDDLFDDQFSSSPELLGERQFYICNGDGKEIGTATAWFNNDHNGSVYGLVHWVAIVPDEHGKGLGNPLMTAVCNRLKESGYKRAYLNTSTVRIPAISLYLKFGFVPEIRNDRDRQVWEHVFTILNSSERK